MPIKDPEKRREYHREYMRKRLGSDPEFKKKHRARIKKNNKRYAVTSKHLIFKFRQSGCEKCGQKNHDVLCAHHRDPKTKEFHIADAIRRKLSPARIETELKKCDCLCLNCHAKLHARLRKEQNGRA